MFHSCWLGACFLFLQLSLVSYRFLHTGTGAFAGIFPSSTVFHFFLFLCSFLGSVGLCCFFFFSLFFYIQHSSFCCRFFHHCRLFSSNWVVFFAFFFSSSLLFVFTFFLPPTAFVIFPFNVGHD
ncbi:hypothetical protein L873DRAFT_296886 [Choiromyces venosus 120613-1]|uniref:Uncharacterized protein n=1 Tax=Choiromyces venosus 120613-1 TaxID=1336337 RepID=A0A3N4J0D6_9PEZI|nr:hypothetical protein L873DRAFT_296886 [Choiromyces venosus 120613-1]